ncbi:MAG: Nucleotidyl transferase [uncultured bacterium (gcode 4)]|uniref:glucose-1-phosphate thymidylyltransferase n=1 Tax=uncultured bacterium (gcode 4) TaxID=1234023 RepID=K2FTI2_9BACT|nr:MAG: Nucleotidyl transferase [uncultured bacterium (gcode 4)]
MKWIILAGWFWTRLHPVTKAVNKHLLPIYNKPMIYYPLETLIESWIDKIMLITNPENVSNFIDLLKSWEEFREKYKRPIQIVYAIQPKPTWIAHGLWIAKDYVGVENCVLMLWDNLFENSIEIKKEIMNFSWWATIFVKEVEDPKRFGVAEIDWNGVVLSLEEKPQNPKTNLAVTWVYIYDNSCFEKSIWQPLSERWEFEITYINELYRMEGNLNAIKLSWRWFDTGTFDSMLVASNFIKDLKDIE